MDSSVTLESMASYAAWPMIVLFLLLLICAATVFFLLWKEKHPAKNSAEVKAPVQTQKPNYVEVKQKYYREINALVIRHKEGKPIRECYQELSVQLRDFVQEMTGVDVSTYTLTDVRQLKVQALTELIEKYYRPEFGTDAYIQEMTPEIMTEQFDSVVEETKAVIEKWN